MVHLFVTGLSPVAVDGLFRVGAGTGSREAGVVKGCATAGMATSRVVGAGLVSLDPAIAMAGSVCAGRSSAHSRSASAPSASS